MGRSPMWHSYLCHKTWVTAAHLDIVFKIETGAMEILLINGDEKLRATFNEAPIKTSPFRLFLSCTFFLFYDKGSYATWGNFPSVDWILINIIITTNGTDNILWLVDSWDFMLSIDHHLWTVRPVVKDLSMLKTKCWWISKHWHN